MARMIPAQIDDSVVSAAERRVFGLLAGDPDTREWTVLHSLGLARRATGAYGEIDFVVIIPAEGVLCLEVKGGRLSCHAGVWQTMDRKGRVHRLKRSPFMQARESMFALRKSIIQHFGDSAVESQTPIGSAVVFPDVVCPPLTPEFERSDVIDIDDLKRPISRSIMRVTRRRLREFQPLEGERLPTPTIIKLIKGFLRPNFEVIVARGVSIGRAEERLVRLTEEQYSRLDELDSNDRCLFQGAAGTGKTLLALEYARRADHVGKNVLLVCFNRLLGRWLRLQVENLGVTAGTWHGIARQMILESSVANEFRQHERRAFEVGDTGSLFGEMYPLYGEAALEEVGPRFDVLVLDEAQDLIDRNTLDFLNLTITGGLAGGRWAIFGDFTRQALYGRGENPLGELSRYCRHFVRARLTLNCRNTRRIAEETALVAGFEHPPFRLGDETGLPVDYRYWKTSNDFLVSLTGIIERLMKEGTSIEDIMILSPRQLRNSLLGSVQWVSRFRLVDISQDADKPLNVLKFSTIHSFKGLESPVVIVVDIEDVDAEEPQALLYVAMSRARSLLILMISEHARTSIERRIRAGIEKELSQ